jgi:preprotein translocase subunit SecG
MIILRSLLLVVEVLCSIMLIGLILLQKSKGGGLGLAFGGGGEGSMFGARTGNVLTKATIILGLLFLVNTLVLGILFTGASGVGESAIDRELMSEPSAQPEPRTSDSPALPDGDEQLAPPAEEPVAAAPESAPEPAVEPLPEAAPEAAPPVE